MFKTTNGAGSWQPAGTGFPSGQSRSRFHRSRQRTSLVGAGRAAASASTSLSRRRAWIPANSGFANTLVRTVALDPDTPQTIYAGTFANGAAKSADGAMTWNAANNGLTEPE